MATLSASSIRSLLPKTFLNKLKMSNKSSFNSENIPPVIDPNIQAADLSPIVKKSMVKVPKQIVEVDRVTITADPSVKVVVRIKSANSNDSVLVEDRKFKFDSVLNLNSKQEDVFELVGVPLVKNTSRYCSVSEAEEKTIKAVCEQMKGNDIGSVTSTSEIYETVRSEVRCAISDIQNDLENSIRQSSATRIATADVTSIAPDLVKPGAVELVLDIRREYARKLEEISSRYCVRGPAVAVLILLESEGKTYDVLTEQVFL